MFSRSDKKFHLLVEKRAAKKSNAIPKQTSRDAIPKQTSREKITLTTMTT